MSGIVVCHLSISAILGYVFHVPTLYLWNHMPMAINTAIALFICGMAITVTGASNNIWKKR